LFAGFKHIKVLILFRLTLFLFTLFLTTPLHAASFPALEAGQGMVVSSQALASKAGLEILQRGGNAIDAAVAVGYALAVVHPCCGNIGGGGFMTLKLADGRETFINFRETAPKAATPTMYLDSANNPVQGASLYGYKAVGVPGTVAGLDYAAQKYGILTREIIMQPAINLAKNGYELTRADADIFEAGHALLSKNDEASRLFLNNGKTLKAGEKHYQTELGYTLEQIAKHGADAFYKGHVAKYVSEASSANGGIITPQDFANYKVQEYTPLTCSYRGFGIISAPPPSSGGVTLCQILGVLEGYDMKAFGYHSAKSVQLMVEAFAHAYADRNAYLGDPDFVNNPIERLLSKDYAAQIRAKIDAGKSATQNAVLPEKTETTHYSVMDKFGNAVSVTYTINGLFGSGVAAAGTGFLLNNEMDDFTIKAGVPNLFGLVQGANNAISPHKRPLSSMSPTIVTKDGKVFMVLGSPGGSRIITIVSQVIMNVIDYGMTPQEAVDAPRIHHQGLPVDVFYERFALSPDTLKILADKGYKLTEQTPWGAAELIEVGGVRDAKPTAQSSGNDAALSGFILKHKLYGANDNRRPAGAASGY
jgi:gamma-glutamyltranspeptidase / glutathione hydrolase